MTGWTLKPDYQHLHADFGSLEQVFALEGERITRDSESELIRIEREGVVYYVKRYRSNGKHWRNWLPHTRIRAEWENLQRFIQWGIPTAEVVAFGLERESFGRFRRGAMITREIPGADDLATLARQGDPCLKDVRWIDEIGRQIADFARIMHQHGFVHNDLKWRNILIDGQPRAYLIDCPTGGFWWGPFLQYRIIKDLACLDKVAKYQLSRTRRLRFYLNYVQRKRLTAADKKRIGKIIVFFAGRE